MGGRVVSAIVVEDLGHLGIHSQRVVRVVLGDPVAPFADKIELEVPVEWLEEMPK